MSHPAAWPTDPRECHDLLDRFNQQAEDLRAALEEAAKLHDQAARKHEQTVEELRRQPELYRRYVFGPRRERLIEAPGQGHLFEIDSVGDVAPPLEPEPPAQAPGALSRPRRSRRPDYDRLPQVRIDHDVPEAEKVCSHCGEAKARIGEDEARVLEFIPARFELHVHVLPKYACSHCRDGVTAPETPPRPLSGCIAGAGALAEVVVSKSAEHMPLYRLEDISTRYGLLLSRSTLCDWVSGVADLLEPLYEFEKDLVRTSPVIWTDDTHVTVWGGRDTPGSHRGQFWVYIGSAVVPYDVYDFTEDRKRDGPVQFLAGYAGYLQADAFSGYDGIYAGSDGGIREVACWAHARRKFFEARPSSPADASLILEMIRRLYEVEDRARPLDGKGTTSSLSGGGADAEPAPEIELDRLSSTTAARQGWARAVTVCVEPMEGVVPVHGGWPADDRQQRVGAPASRSGDRAEELDVPGERPSGPASGGAMHDHRGSEAAPPRAVGVRAGRDPAALGGCRSELAELLPRPVGYGKNPEHVLSHRLEESRQKARRQDQRRADRRRIK